MTLSYHNISYETLPVAIANADFGLFVDLEAIAQEEPTPRRSWRDALKKIRVRHDV